MQVLTVLADASADAGDWTAAIGRTSELLALQEASPAAPRATESSPPDPFPSRLATPRPLITVKPRHPSTLDAHARAAPVPPIAASPTGYYYMV